MPSQVKILDQVVEDQDLDLHHVTEAIIQDQEVVEEIQVVLEEIKVGAAI